MFNSGDKVRIVVDPGLDEIENAEAGWVGTVVGPADNGDDWIVDITDRSGAVFPASAWFAEIVNSICGDRLSYPTADLELV